MCMKILSNPTRWLSIWTGVNAPTGNEIPSVEGCKESKQTRRDGGGWGDKEPSNAVANVVADREGVATENLPPIYSSIDPDGLNAVIQSSTDATVTFEHCGYEVTVTGRGELQLSNNSEK